MKKYINYFLLKKLYKKIGNKTQHCEQCQYSIFENIGGNYKVAKMTQRLDQYVSSPSMIVRVKGMKAHVVNYFNDESKPSVYMERSTENSKELDDLLYSLLSELKSDLKSEKSDVDK